MARNTVRKSPSGRDLADFLAPGTIRAIGYTSGLGPIAVASPVPVALLAANATLPAGLDQADARLGVIAISDGIAPGGESAVVAPGQIQIGTGFTSPIAFDSQELRGILATADRKNFQAIYLSGAPGDPNVADPTTVVTVYGVSNLSQPLSYANTSILWFLAGAP